MTLISIGERMTWKTFYVVEWGRSDWFYWERKWLGREWHGKIWLMKKIWKRMYTWYSWNLDVFHPCWHQCQRGRFLAWMLMLWGNIVEHCYDYVCHWWQHSNEFVKTNRVVECDLCINYNTLCIYLCTLTSTYYSIHWTHGQVRRSWIDSVQKILIIYKEPQGNKALGK